MHTALRSYLYLLRRVLLSNPRTRETSTSLLLLLLPPSPHTALPRDLLPYYWKGKQRCHTACCVYVRENSKNSLGKVIHRPRRYIHTSMRDKMPITSTGEKWNKAPLALWQKLSGSPFFQNAFTLIVLYNEAMELNSAVGKSLKKHDALAPHPIVSAGANAYFE